MASAAAALNTALSGLAQPAIGRLIDSYAEGLIEKPEFEPRIADLVIQLSDPQAPPIMVKQLTWLSSDVPGWLQDTIRLACGRALAQRRLYDEALPQRARAG